MTKTRKYFLGAVLTSFPGVILLANTDSYFADKNNLNTVFTVAGIVLCAVSAYCMYMANKYGNPGNPKNQ